MQKTQCALNHVRVWLEIKEPGLRRFYLWYPFKRARSADDREASGRRSPKSVARIPTRKRCPKTHPPGGRNTHASTKVVCKDVQSTLPLESPNQSSLHTAGRRATCITNKIQEHLAQSSLHRADVAGQLAQNNLRTALRKATCPEQLAVFKPELRECVLRTIFALNSCDFQTKTVGDGCSVEVAWRKLLYCASCPAQVALCKWLCAIGFVQLVLCNLLCAGPV